MVLFGHFILRTKNILSYRSMKVTIQSIIVSKYFVFKDIAILQLNVDIVEEDGYIMFTRFSNFKKFHKDFTAELTEQDRSLLSYIPPSPPKRFNNRADAVLTERKILISNFFTKILRFSLNDKINSLRQFIDPISGPNAQITFLMLQFLDIQRVSKKILTKIERGFVIREGNITNITIKGHFIRKGSTYYKLHVSNHNLPAPYNTWDVDARYNTLLEFHKNVKRYLQDHYPSLLLVIPSFPLKELSMGVHSKTVANRRTCILNNYFLVLLLIKEIRESRLFEEFLGL